MFNKIYFCLVQDCVTPDVMSGNCINFRFCNRIVNLIVQNQQKRDMNIENYIRKSICGYEGQDPKVCCASLVFTGNAPPPPSTSSQSQPAPFIFSSIYAPTSPVTSQPTMSGQPTFSPLHPNAGNTGNSSPIPSTNQPTPGNVIFSPVGTPTGPPTQTPAPTSTTPGALLNRLPTFEQDKCGVSYAVRSRIVG